MVITQKFWNDLTNSIDPIRPNIQIADQYFLNWLEPAAQFELKFCFNHEILRIQTLHKWSLDEASIKKSKKYMTIKGPPEKCVDKT